jgi:hypothetical protein
MLCVGSEDTKIISTIHEPEKSNNIRACENIEVVELGKCWILGRMHASNLPNLISDLLHLLKFLQQYEAIAINDWV